MLKKLILSFVENALNGSKFSVKKFIILKKILNNNPEKEYHGFYIKYI